METIDISLPCFQRGFLLGSSNGEWDRRGNMTSQILNRQTLAASCLQEKHARKYLLKSQTSHLDRPDRPSWLDSQTLEPDILECEVKWALGSITMNKASRSDVIPVELFQILKDNTVEGLHSICQQIWKTEVATGLEKVSYHSNPKERQCQRMLERPRNCTQLTC